MNVKFIWKNVLTFSLPGFAMPAGLCLLPIFFFNVASSYASSVFKGKSPLSGVRRRSPLKFNATLKLSEQYCALDLTIWPFGSFRYPVIHPSLLTLAVKQIYWSHVLGAGSFMFGAICGIWGLSPHVPCPCMQLLINSTGWNKLMTVIMLALDWRAVHTECDA